MASWDESSLTCNDRCSTSDRDVWVVLLVKRRFCRDYIVFHDLNVDFIVEVDDVFFVTLILVNDHLDVDV